MPNSHSTPFTLLWPSASPGTLNTNNRVAAGNVNISPDAFSAAVQLQVSVTSPASGDYVDVWVAWNLSSGGSPDTEEHAQRLGRLNMFPSDDPGENPARQTFDLPINGKFSFNLIVKANQGASRAVTITGTYLEQRST